MTDGSLRHLAYLERRKIIFNHLNSAEEQKVLSKCDWKH